MNTIHPSAVIHPNAKIGEDVTIGPNAVIDEHVTIGDRCQIWANAYITGHTTMGPDNLVHMGAVIGHWPQHTAYDPSTPAYVEIGAGNTFREQCIIHASFAEGQKTTIGDKCFFMHQSHVAHDCHIGNRVTIASCSLAAGHVTVEDGAFISGLVAIHQFSRIGSLAMVGGVSRVNRDVPPYMMLVGDSEVVGLNVVGLKRSGLSPDVRKKIRRAYKTLYHSGLTTPQAIERLQAEADCDEVRHIADFIANSQRGICGHK
ncbi:acyl-ACP--UDP-N-acetylglucosamine O-acyltransferase [Candidatus Sumerlaeota bacterium]|nr:acyl-ACP--UDP-N-acetylglucosamine O-acyltransferase [Candidatus Sumerlaeota bacterium]